MCLVNYKEINMGERKKPIECYKILENVNGQLISPLYSDHKGGSLWAVGDVNKTKCAEPDIYYYVEWLECKVNSINGGGFHTCKTLKDARTYLNNFSLKKERKLVIAQCEITLDTKFVYEGLAVWDSWDPGVPGYVSESLKIVKIIE